MTPTFKAAPMRRARCSGSLPFVLRRNAPAVDAERIASRSARDADTGMGAGAAPAALPAVDIGATPGPTAAAEALPGAPVGGRGAGGAGVVGGPRGTGGAGGAPLGGAALRGAAPAEVETPPTPVLGPAPAAAGGGAAGWLGAGAGEVAGADDANGGGAWFTICCIGEGCALAALVGDAAAG
ncbi:hypothetical protein [Mycolicibacterium iranicum]|uniref:Uncharacterized protein n=1 Tax=Mycolicibacterium iranicum TaxID=912594 RepID=A0ABT4HLY0_MYCIR|nr:hypothetical protein [Mycolicibacterium iranicum]MCZ0731221.1 hypothetical protein [Mycolicibacterium iranicum]